MVVSFLWLLTSRIPNSHFFTQYSAYHHPQRTADTKAKATQYFTILNRIEYVITLDAKYSEPSFLFFFRKFNTIYNMMYRTDDMKDPIEVYFDNQIGIIEVETTETIEKKKKETQIAHGKAPGESHHQYSILDIIEARNQHEELIGLLIQDFESKVAAFFEYVRQSREGERLIVKIKSHISENEIYEDFGKIYRRYKALNRKKVGEYFFKEIDDIVDKLCDDFEAIIRTGEAAHSG
jgi:type I restriction enzyme R subunit